MSNNGNIGVLKGGQFLLIALAFPLKFLGDLLLENQGFKSVVSLLLGTGEANREAGVVVLLLIDETS